MNFPLRMTTLTSAQLIFPCKGQRVHESLLLIYPQNYAGLTELRTHSHKSLFECNFVGMGALLNSINL